MLRINDRHNGAVAQLKLMAEPKFVLLALAAHADDRGAGAVTMPDLRVMVCLREEVTQEHLDDLEQLGLVTITGRTANAGDAPMVYTLPFVAEQRPS